MNRPTNPLRNLHKLTSASLSSSTPFLLRSFLTGKQAKTQLDLNPDHPIATIHLLDPHSKESKSAETLQPFDATLHRESRDISTASLPKNEHNPIPSLGLTPDPHMYTHLLRSFLTEGNSAQSRRLFEETPQRRAHVLRNSKILHARILKFGFELGGNLGNTLVDLYAKCGDLCLALKAFDQLIEQDGSAWNSILSAYSRLGLLEEAVCIFGSMRNVNAQMNQFTFAIVLSACARLAALGFGRLVHVNIIKMGFESNSFCEGSLIDMYAKCDCVIDARRVFDRVSNPDMVSWTVMIAGYVRIGLSEEALELFWKMRKSGSKQDQVVLVTAITACVSLGRLKEAHDLFAQMPNPNVVAWNVMISGHAQHGYEVEALSFFYKMRANNFKSTRSTLGSVLSAIANITAIDLGQQVHSEAIKLGLDLNFFVGSSLINMYAKCCIIDYARKIFDLLDDKNVVLWNAMLGGYVQNGHADEVMTLFSDMKDKGIPSDEFTYVSILTACASLGSLDMGHQLHSAIIKRNLEESLFVGNAVVDMYAKSGDLKDARQQFELIRDRDNVSWNAILVGYVHDEDETEALIMFRRMVSDDIAPDEVSLATILSACANVQALDQGQQFHCVSIKYGLELNVYIGSSVIDMYAKCGAIAAANKAFFQMPEKSVVSWNALIAGYIQKNNAEEALDLFRRMQAEGLKPSQFTFASILTACSSPYRLTMGRQVHCYTLKSGFSHDDAFVGISLLAMYVKSLSNDDANKLFWEMPDNNSTVSWTAIISGHAQNNFSEEALRLFHEMRSYGVRPDQATFVSVLKASASLAALRDGKEVHSLIIQTGFNQDEHTGIALIDMYSKCGDVRSSQQVFDEMDSKQDVTLWNSMIVGFSKNGYIEDALRLFDQMQQENLRPDDVTFLGVLTACSHAGLVTEGCRFFDSMRENYGIWPRADHFACMVDLLGRGGYLKEAEDFIDSLPLKPDAIIWATLLSACRMHRDDIRGQRAAEKLIELEPQNSSPYVLLSNIYAASGNWDGVNLVRKAMRDRGVRKLPGCSWIVVGKNTNLFVAGDKFHPKASDIYGLLKELTALMKEDGYVARLDLVSHDED
ncbi:pentatricopeptide repeat-containing protein At3g09040, mitochondrial [Magnolia sinica]|uniref:pentatricopeptide repeat-containing protein At3g09040, mitochondrial n=1 Tax=Magnolia sinica TaxID=86752 RepID=UPI00265ABE9B|nr:pentatricopeptide repeat-containing protein At3g09040, mitochondrial [Magnolia sinica]